MANEDASALVESFHAAAKATRVAGWINVILPTVWWGLFGLVYATARQNDRAHFKIEDGEIFITIVLLVPGIAYLWSAQRIGGGSKPAMQVARIVGLVQLLGYGWNLTKLASDGRNGVWVVGAIVFVLAVASLIVVIACTSAIGAISRQEPSPTPP